MSYTFSRRDFMKYTALAAAAVAVSGSLTGCSNPNRPVGTVGSKLKPGDGICEATLLNSAGKEPSYNSATQTLTCNFKIVTKIELLEPTSEDSTIAKYIENRGVGIHHMALACENIEEQLADAEAKGIRLIDKTPRKGAEGMTIAFLHPKSTQGILTELCENKNK